MAHQKGGIVAVDEKGVLFSKVSFSDFVPHRIAVDGQNQVWVIGQEVNPMKVGLATKYRIPVDPKNPTGEQLRVFTHNLQLIGILVRDQKVGRPSSSVTTSGDEVVYYAGGTNTIRLFRKRQLVHSLVVPQLEITPELAEVAADAKRRIVTTVSKIGNSFLLIGYYAHASGPEPKNNKFMAIVSADGEAASPEFEPPAGIRGLTDYSWGYMTSLARKEGLLHLNRVRLRPELN